MVYNRVITKGGLISGVAEAERRKMEKRKTSDAQLNAIKNWRQRNPEKARYNSSRTSARTFARKYATKEDMDELIEIFKNENKNYSKGIS